MDEILMHEILNIVTSLSTLVSIVALAILWVIAMYEVVKRKDLKKSRLLWIALLLLPILIAMHIGLIMQTFLFVWEWVFGVASFVTIALIMYFFTEKRKKQGYIAGLFFFIIIASFIVFLVSNMFFLNLGPAIR